MPRKLVRIDVLPDFMTCNSKNIVNILGFIFRLSFMVVCGGNVVQGQDDVINLDKTYLTYHRHIEEPWNDAAQYYFRRNVNSDYVPLYHNPSIDLNVPICARESDKIVCRKGNEKNTNFFKDPDESTAVSISNVDGKLIMGGVMLSENSSYTIEPITNQEEVQSNKHIIRKRATGTIIGRRRVVSSSGRTIMSSEPTRFNFIEESGSFDRFRTYRKWFERITAKTTKKKPKWKKPSKPQKNEYTVYLLAVIDYSIYRKFLGMVGPSENATMSKLRYYFAHVVNGINLRFANIRDPEFTLKVALVGFYVAKSASDFPFINAWKMENDARYRVDGKATLEGLTKFLKQRKIKKTLPDYNHAMLFLEYTATNQRGSILGTSFLSGICTRLSTSLVVDHGAYTSAGIAAHELGHNLGVVNHDGEGEGANCPKSLNYIMAPASALIDKSNLEFSFKFSSCSVNQIKKLMLILAKRRRNCLTKKASPKEVNFIKPFLNILPGEIDDVHEQCRQLYGNESFMCPPNSPDEMCYRMYCYDPRHGLCAIVSEQKAAFGTPCGSKKWCYMGKCVPNNRAPAVPDDCPYPDLPEKGAHCGDATPFMCENDSFKKKCCESCSKNFTDAELCKDTSVKINMMNCKDFVSVFGETACTTDYKVKNFCCKSCQASTETTPARTQSIYNALMGRQQPRGGSPTKGRQKSKPTQVKPTPKKTNSCDDLPNVKVNNMPCREFVLKNRKMGACSQSNILAYCCGSCRKYG